MSSDEDHPKMEEEKKKKEKKEKEEKLEEHHEDGEKKHEKEDHDHEKKKKKEKKHEKEEDHEDKKNELHEKPSSPSGDPTHPTRIARAGSHLSVQRSKHVFEAVQAWGGDAAEEVCKDPFPGIVHHDDSVLKVEASVAAWAGDDWEVKEKHEKEKSKKKAAKPPKPFFGIPHHEVGEDGKPVDL